MIWLLLIFGALALLNKQESLQKSKPALPPSLEGLNKQDPRALAEAAKNAQIAGYVETAKVLASKAQEANDIARAVSVVSVSAPYKSPIPGVGDDKWSAFTKLFQGKEPSEVSPANHLGMFNIGFLRLRDLGLATDVTQIERDGRRIWVGRLTSGMTLEKFLSSPTLQYAVFARDMTDRAKYILANHRDLIGKSMPEVPTVPATLSGLLAVIKIAGTKGFESWISSRKERAKFGKTLEAFKTANGYF